MRQVPSSIHTPVPYVLLGDGRLSKHLQFYFTLLGLRYQLWSRTSNVALDTLPGAAIFLLAVSDGAIESVAQQVRLAHPGARLVHFSGAVVTPLACGWHPLMSFGPKMFEQSFYEAIPFVGERDGLTFSSVFPTLKNPNFTIASADKARYHALCVMAGNFAQLLWAKATHDFNQHLALPGEILRPFLQASLDNFFGSGGPMPGEKVITGPLVRRDYSTIRKHLIALRDDPFLATYRSFVSTYGGQHEDFRLSEVQT